VLWDVATGRERLRLQGRAATAAFGVAFSPDGRTLALAGYEDRRVPADFAGGRGLIPQVSLWDVVAQDERAVVRGHDRPVTYVAFTPDGRTLATGSQDHTVELWRLSP
jgi:WD40 repeat protein